MTRRIHPSNVSVPSPIRLYGRRVLLRPLVAHDFEAWSEVRTRNTEWLTKWEPLPPAPSLDSTRNRDAFASRCLARDRDQQSGSGFAFGIFIDRSFAGEINLNNVLRGALQGATIGYWIDESRAGRGYVAESVVVLAQFAFDELLLHRLEICIIPRNRNSRRVMEKLGIREEGVAERFLEINGTWEDHVRYGFTVEEWRDRREDLSATWL